MAVTAAICAASAAAGLLGLFVVRKLRQRHWGYCKSKRSLDGLVCIVTGANSGIGKELAKEMAKRGAKVVLACRNLDNARQAIEDIRCSGVPTGELIPMKLDLASLESVREFCKEALERFPEIHILVNNAGVSVPMDQKKKTADGFEIHFGTNHLGHFLLTNLLLDRLIESIPSRIVTVSSTLHEKGEINFDDLQLEKYQPDPKKKRANPGYNNSKLANALFSQELATRLPDGVSTYSVCPGFCFTGLFKSFSPKLHHYILFSPIMFWYMRSAYQGAQGVAYCAFSEKTEGQTGQFYRDCKFYQSKANLDPEIAKKLWDVSEKLVGL